MNKNSRITLTALLMLVTGHTAAAPAAVSATVVPLANGGQASIAVSNTDPNLFTVAGDRVTALTSLDGELTRQEQTASGGVIVSTLNKKPFTFILETERGLNFSVQAVPRAGVGRTIRLVSELSGTGEVARTWEESSPYESTLVSLSQHLLGGKLPSGWQSIPVTNERLNAPVGLVARAERVWVGNHLKVVSYRITNSTAGARNLTESDFWQQGIRGVLFAESARQVMAGGALQVFIISGGGAVDGQY
ncbi:conjugal transfer protein TraK (plasmid) [Serratia marcescens]|uniref:type-F conjugative transfer system secretin TraK n=1 Tax=Serratia nevei TaxID=2703794 RepID=UPI0011F136B1|nr:conjugal transfer protein TraK [Serratia marcescens]HEJ7857744.1 type-F conjugative transfer system secretin TraK [Serratia marcescens]